MAGTRFKAENGLLVSGSNSIFEQTVQMNANLTVNADLIAIVGNLYVGGSSIIVGNTLYDTDILPVANTGRTIGNNTNRFDGYFRFVSVTGTLMPSANALPLGNATNRWLVTASDGNFSGTLTVSTANITGTIAVGGAASISNTLAAGNTTVTGFVNVSTSAQVSGTLTVNGAATFNNTVSFASNVSSPVSVLDYAIITSNTRTVTNTSVTIIDSFPKTIGNSGKLFLSVNKANTTLHVTNMSFIHDGTNVLTTNYGELYNTAMGTFDAAINGANLEIYFTAATANTYLVRTLRHIVKS